MLPRHVLACAVLVALPLAIACRDGPVPVAPPSYSNGATWLVSGTVRGPDGMSICNSVPELATFRVQIFDPVTTSSTAPFVGSQELTCPADEYAIPLGDGTYRLRVVLPRDPGIGTLPWRYLDPAAITVSTGDVTHDVQIADGVAMGGGVTLDGAPIAGSPMSIRYDPWYFMTAALAVSGGDGAWDDDFDDFDRSPLMLQPGVRYWASSACLLLGTRALALPPTESFLFPTERSAINCTLETGPATSFSHDRTRLVVTPLPGDVGGQSGELFSQYGRGWGVQFPIGPNPLDHAIASSHLYLGGLIVGIQPNVVLSGVDVGGYLDCSTACRDLGLDATMHVSAPAGGGKVVEWRYSDVTSLEGVGLQVVQESFDGKPPSDYVLFRFTFKNLGRATVTFHAGFFGDWDIDVDHLDDIGATDLGGRLMYATNDGNVGSYAGTLILGPPVTGNYFWDNAKGRLSLVEQVNALAGWMTQPSIGPGGDLRHIHGVGPITLKRTKSADVWIAIVAGEDLSHLLANAGAAQADVTSRTRHR
jgi:hypothetical protein